MPASAAVHNMWSPAWREFHRRLRRNSRRCRSINTLQLQVLGGLLELGDENEGRPDSEVSGQNVLHMFVTVPVAEAVQKRVKNEILRRIRATN